MTADDTPGGGLTMTIDLPPGPPAGLVDSGVGGRDAVARDAVAHGAVAHGAVVRDAAARGAVAGEVEWRAAP